MSVIKYREGTSRRTPQSVPHANLPIVGFVIAPDGTCTWFKNHCIRRTDVVDAQSSPAPSSSTKIPIAAGYSPCSLCSVSHGRLSSECYPSRLFLSWYSSFSLSTFTRPARKKLYGAPDSFATSYALPSIVGQVCGKHGWSIHSGVLFDSRVRLFVMNVIMAIAMCGHHYSSCVVSVPGASTFRVASRPAQPCLLSWLCTCAV